jgi:hypothetical protein
VRVLAFRTVAVCEVEAPRFQLCNDDHDHTAPAPWPQLQDEFVTAQIGSDDFHHFHQAWPFLHVPTFTLEEHTLLTSAMANLFMWIRNAANRNHLLPDIINQELIKAFVHKGVSTLIVSIA